MIREKRSKEKLETYYRKFMEEGVMDANVHPYVAESWQKSRDWKVGSARLEGLPRLGKEEFRLRQGRHQVGLGAAVDLGVGRDHPHEQGRSRPRRADEEDQLVLHERS